MSHFTLLISCSLICSLLILGQDGDFFILSYLTRVRFVRCGDFAIRVAIHASGVMPSALYYPAIPNVAFVNSPDIRATIAHTIPEPARAR